MSDGEMWQILEEQGVFIHQYDGNNNWWGYSIAHKNLSVEWTGPYESRQEAFQAVIEWMLSEAAEHLGLSVGLEHVHLYTPPMAPHSEEIAAFELLLDQEKIPEEQFLNDRLMDIALHSADVSYNETSGRAEFQSTDANASWCVWRMKEEWVLEVGEKSLRVPQGQLYSTIFREVGSLVQKQSNPQGSNE
ncbi:MAG: hypothetical protein OHK0022_34110 [Roseiflexaceae bacterium]